MGTEVGPWEGLNSAIADTLYDLAGYLVVRSTASYAAGDTSIMVESTDRFLATGRIVFGGKIAVYASKTDTSFDGLTDLYTGDPGVETALATGSTVMDFTRLTTQMDGLRAAFLLPYALEAELDTLGRNYGILRTRGLDDDTFRALLQAWIYLEAQTIYACEQILDVLWGVGGYDLYEDLESYPHTVFVRIPSETAIAFLGKTFVVGGESQPSTGAFTVDVNFSPTLVFGVYDSADPGRVGTNYANKVIAAATPGVAPFDRIFTGVATFIPSDVGKPIIIDGTEYWVIAERLSTTQIRAAGRQHDDGTVTNLDPDVLASDRDWFSEWQVGHRIQIVSTIPANDGTYTITERISPYSVRLAGAAFVPESDVQWRLLPLFGAAAVSLQLPRATVSGNTITTPAGPLPATVLVDYTTIPSAQALEGPGSDGNAQYPFYLWDSSFITQSILDLITAAGVRVIVISE